MTYVSARSVNHRRHKFQMHCALGMLPTSCAPLLAGSELLRRQYARLRSQGIDPRTLVLVCGQCETIQRVVQPHVSRGRRQS